jgi:hypothetical protein
MGRKQQKKKHHGRNHGRKQGPKAPTTTAPAQTEESGGWMSWAFGADRETEVESGIEHEEEAEAEYSLWSTSEDVDGGKKDGESGGWLSWLPSLKWGAETGSETQHTRKGDDDNHLDVLSTARKGEASLKLGAEGAEGELSYEAQAALLKAAGKKEGTIGDAIGLEATTEASVLQAGLGAEIGAKVDQSGLDASAKAEIGAYLAKGEAGLEAALKIPWINAVIYGSFSGEGQAGVGASAEGELQAGADGFEASGKAGAAFGLGGKLGFGFGFKKAEKDKGWLDSSAKVGGGS